MPIDRDKAVELAADRGQLVLFVQRAELGKQFGRVADPAPVGRIDKWKTLHIGESQCAQTQQDAGQILALDLGVIVLTTG